MTYNPVKICCTYCDRDSTYIKFLYEKSMYTKGIPKFAKGYEKEYRYIRGINKLFLHLINKLVKIKENNIDYDFAVIEENYMIYEDITNIRLENLVKNDIFYKEFFESKSFNNIIKIIKRFLKYQELNKIKDISNLIFPRIYLDNIRYINNFFCFYKLAYVENYYFGFEEIYNLF